jgi:septum formation protein
MEDSAPESPMRTQVMNSPVLILASASPRRADLLRQWEFEFIVVPSAAEEIHSEDLSAGEVAQVNAYRKARVVSKRFPDAVTLGVDTVVSLGSSLFGKPANLADAERIVLALQGKTHQVVTGVCLIHLRRHRQKIFWEQTDVTFRALTPEQIRHYHTQVNPLDKAGAYGIQEKSGAAVVESISGSFSNVAGLPMERLSVELAAFGILQPAAR